MVMRVDTFKCRYAPGWTSEPKRIQPHIHVSATQVHHEQRCCGQVAVSAVDAAVRAGAGGRLGVPLGHHAHQLLRAGHRWVQRWVGGEGHPSEGGGPLCDTCTCGGSVGGQCRRMRSHCDVQRVVIFPDWGKHGWPIVRGGGQGWRRERGKGEGGELGGVGRGGEGREKGLWKATVRQQ
jgi:hypothetical protein